MLVNDNPWITGQRRDRPPKGARVAKPNLPDLTLDLSLLLSSQNQTGITSFLCHSTVPSSYPQSIGAGISLTVFTPRAESQPPPPTWLAGRVFWRWAKKRKTKNKKTEWWGVASNWTSPQMKIKPVWKANVGQWENETLFTIHHMGGFPGTRALPNVGCLWIPIRLVGYLSSTSHSTLSLSIAVYSRMLTWPDEGDACMRTLNRSV